MNDDLTPWEDINPPMASAQRRGQVSQCSADEQARLTFRNELTACLTLVAPVGMNEESRRDWFAVAWSTLKDIPPDILKIGAQIARQKCDHPAKIVPTIIAETVELMRWERERHNAGLDGPKQIAGPELKYVTPDEVDSIMREFGFRSSFDPDTAQ
jgi:hypothetical protein